MLNGVTLPPKNVLIDVCRKELCFDYSKVKLARLVSLKDRVILVIYMHAKLHASPPKTRLKADQLVSLFVESIGDRPHLLDEMTKYSAEQPKGKPKAIWTSLELNLSLAFLYLSAIACGLPVLERDVLNGAAANRFGYLNGYLKTCAKFEPVLSDCKINLALLLRPINVAHQPKWLRQTARDLDKTLNTTFVTA